MAKKKTTDVGSTLGYGFIVEDGSPAIRDNRIDGPSNLPNNALAGYGYGRGAAKICFADNIGKGEGIVSDDVIVNVPNGISKQRGKNPGQQGNYCPQSAWSEDKDFEGNMSGM